MKHFLYLGSIACMFMLGACSSSEEEPQAGPVQSPEYANYSFQFEKGEAILTGVPSTSYDVVIPSEIIEDNTIYPVTSIGKEAFRNIEYINSLTLPSSIKLIEEDAFLNTIVGNLYIEDLSSWCHIEFEMHKSDQGGDSTPSFANPISPETKLYIGGEAIMSDLTIPSEVSDIGACAFRNLNLQGKLILSEGVVTVGNYSFEGAAFKEIQFPQSLEFINSFAFSECKFMFAELPEGVQAIWSYAFANSELKHVTLPSGLISIAAGTFYNSKLEDIVLQDGMQNIGNYAFSKCQIQEITLPESLKKIGASAFAETPVTKINVASLEAWLNIDKGFYSEYEVPYPYGMAFDSYYTLYAEGKPLENIELPDGLTSINDVEFYRCLIKSITIPSSVTRIGLGAFKDCTNLSDLEISESGETIEVRNLAFAGCSSLTTLKLPGRFSDFIDSGETRIFADCTSLTSVTLQDGIEYLPQAFFDGCSSLCDIKLPHTLQQTSLNCFTDCRNLKQLIFPEGFISTAFSIKDCTSLERVSYPSTVTGISDNYDGCINLKSIEIMALNVPSSYGSIDTLVAENCTVYVPMQSVEAYKADSYWGKFKHIEGKAF